MSWGALAVGAVGSERRTARRRFTGSREGDYGTPNGFFVTAFMNDNPAPLDLAAWRLRIVGLVDRPLALGHDDLRADAAMVATVDCTGGVYATREWSGLSLGALLDAAGVADEARLAWFVSVTGHRWPLPIDEARRALLATHVGGEPLAHEHGFPLRLVAPERRGFQWVKWLDTIEIA
jgi:DMSO/TMAO reductase YedYZ molybdopterin-dependent catalytic subunit